MKLTPYWTDNTPRPENLPTQGAPRDVDVAVVGSGFTGLNAAIEVAKSGLSVAVFEKETIGWGASSRNGGLIGTGLFVPMNILEKRYGKGSAKAFYDWADDSIDYVETLVREEGIDCDFDRCGNVHLASKPAHFPELVKYHQYLTDTFGISEYEIIQPEDIKDEIGSSIYHGGILGKHGAGIDPAKYIFGLARTAKKYGAELYENAVVRRVSKHNGSFSLTTAKGDVKARQLLIATNGYTTRMLPRIRFGVFPGACYAIVTEPLSEELRFEISPKARVFYDSRYYINYFRVLADGRLLLGGRKTLVQGHDLNRSAKELQNRLVEIYPQLKGIEITNSWTGTLGFTFDQMPHVGQLDGIFYAYGYMGHGVSVGSKMGYEVGQIITSQRDSNPFKDIKHPRYFFSIFDRVFFPVVCAWYRLMDMVR